MPLTEDKDFAAELLGHIIAEQNDRPRSNQAGIGPSELGGCRERLRATWQGDPGLPDPFWHLAAEIGTVMGDELERIMSKRAGAMTQVAVHAVLPRTGLRVSGHADVVWKDRNIVGDFKSKDGLGGVRYEGVSMSNAIQLAVYTLGLVQMGVLQEGATGYLLYYDRAGNDLELMAAPIPWDGLMRFIEIAEARLQDVVDAQSALDAGNLEPRHELRDMPPSFCFSPKVMCPFREACWKGSDYDPTTVITAEEIIRSTERYKAARDAAKAAEQMKREAREELRDVSGVLPDGTRVGWGPRGISIT
jgi:hypothetical protein